VDWENDCFYTLVNGGTTDYANRTGIRKFSISTATELAFKPAGEIAAAPWYFRLGIYGFVVANGNLYITYYDEGNSLRTVGLDGATLEVLFSDQTSTYAGTYYDAWFDNIGLRTEYTITSAVPEPVSIATIIRDIMQRCTEDFGLEDDEDYNVTELEERFVLGYALTRPDSGRGGIEPLRQVGFFDIVESMGLLKFPRRGKAPVATLTVQDLAARPSGDQVQPAVTTSMAMDTDLPMRVTMRYMSAARDYEPGEQKSPARYDTDSVQESFIEVPISISGTMAAQCAETLMRDSWAGRWQHDISLDRAWLWLDAADVILVPIDGRNYRCRIEQINDNLIFLRKLNLRRDDDGSYTSYALADSPQRNYPSVIVFGPSTLVLLDLPPLRDADDDAGIYVVAYRTDASRSWSGAVIHRSADAGATFAQLASVSTEGTVGTLNSTLGSALSTVWDEANEILVDLEAGSFESRTSADVLAGANALAVGAPGRWEIIQFRIATQLGERTYKLSKLLRGRRGTEHNIGNHVSGDTVVLLSAGGVARLPLQLTDIGKEYQYRAVSVGTTVATAETIAFIGEGEALKPFSPVQIAGARDGSNNLTLTWVRRGRLGQELMSGIDIPLSEATEEYVVEITDGGSPVAVLRTITGITSPTTTYSAAQQTSDGLTPGDPVTVRIYQVSASVGRGHAGEATV
jgi:hypothetical protein